MLFVLGFDEHLDLSDHLLMWVVRFLKYILFLLPEFEALREAEEIWTELVLDFEPPNRFNPEKYLDGLKPVPDDVWEAVPRVVIDAVSACLGPDVPIDAQIAFRYFKNGRLPEFVVCYFMWLQKARRSTAKSTVFFRAFHYLESFREYMLTAAGAFEAIGPDPEASLMDPAIAGRGPAVGEDIGPDPEASLLDPAIAGHGPSVGEADGPGESEPEELGREEDKSRE